MELRSCLSRCPTTAITKLDQLEICPMIPPMATKRGRALVRLNEAALSEGFPLQMSGSCVDVISGGPLQSVTNGLHLLFTSVWHQPLEGLQTSNSTLYVASHYSLAVSESSTSTPANLSQSEQDSRLLYSFFPSSIGVVQGVTASAAFDRADVGSDPRPQQRVGQRRPHLDRVRRLRVLPVAG